MTATEQMLDELRGLRVEVAALDKRLAAHCAVEEALAKARRVWPGWISAAAAWVAALVAFASQFGR